MRAAAGANDFIPAHAQRFILMLLDIGRSDGLIKTWPPCSRIEFGIGREEIVSTSNTLVVPLLVVIPVATRKGSLRPLFTSYFILFRSQLFLRFLIGLRHFIHDWALLFCLFVRTAFFGRLCSNAHSYY